MDLPFGTRTTTSARAWSPPRPVEMSTGRPGAPVSKRPSSVTTTRVLPRSRSAVEMRFPGKRTTTVLAPPPLVVSTVTPSASRPMRVTSTTVAPLSAPSMRTSPTRS